MRWLVDERVHRIIVDNLRNAGHDVTFVTDAFPSSPDEPVYAFAAFQDRLLLTHDPGFGEFAVRFQFPRTAGVVMFRLRVSAIAFQWQRLQAALADGASLAARRSWRTRGFARGPLAD
jgi:predicted nuclease of predicted toxin-antitoxin system